MHDAAAEDCHFGTSFILLLIGLSRYLLLSKSPAQDAVCRQRCCPSKMLSDEVQTRNEPVTNKGNSITKICNRLCIDFFCIQHLAFSRRV